MLELTVYRACQHSQSIHFPANVTQAAVDFAVALLVAEWNGKMLYAYITSGQRADLVVSINVDPMGVCVCYPGDHAPEGKYVHLFKKEGK